MDYPIEKYKFYQAGSKVIAVSTYAGKAVRGIAICAPGDTFDLEKGKQLAAARCNEKIAEKRSKRAYKKFCEASRACIAAKAKEAKMNRYCNDALWALRDARSSVKEIVKSL